MTKYIMYPHGGSGNHGCEAIVRSTMDIIRKNYKKNEVMLYSTNPKQDISFGLDNVCSIRLQNLPIRKLSLNYIKAVFLYNALNKKDAYDLVSFRGMFSKSKEDTIALSIGGDNYCYGRPEHIYFMNKYIRKKGTKTVLWGCSVNPDGIDNDMRQDLKEYDLIIARESISYEALKKINHNTKVYPDPAFILEKKELPLPSGFSEGNTVGINLSPMIIGNENQQGVTMENYVSLIQYIINNTDMNIALIPHVTWEHNNDLVPLTELYNRFSGTGRVLLIGNNYNCMELKGFISRLRFFIAARTHASIAAYSSCVPTLVIGYSVKARGIARDIFGNEDNYIIPVQEMKDKVDIINRFRYIMENENCIKEHLVKIMPGYKEKAFNAAIELDRLL